MTSRPNPALTITSPASRGTTNAAAATSAAGTGATRQAISVAAVATPRIPLHGSRKLLLA